jgi:hypothetical protein
MSSAGSGALEPPTTEESRLRRFLIIGTAVAVLAGAAVAYAATLNKYTASVSVTPTAAGTPAKPVSVGFTEKLGAANATSGKVAAVLVNIKTTIYGLITNASKFPTCSSAKILTPPKYDGNCPKGSEVATGAVNAEIGGPTLDPTKAISCKPGLDVWNGGGGKAWYFFTAKSPTQCGGLTTGQTAPYPGTMKRVGKNLVLNVPLPPDVSTKVANHANLYGSLSGETLVIKKSSYKGKPLFASVGCKGGKRPFSVSFTAVPAAGAAGVTQTVTGSGKC